MKLSKAEFAVKAAMASMEEQRKQERERQGASSPAFFECLALTHSRSWQRTRHRI